MKDNKERIALVPGSFDPITNGHLAIIEKASRLYDKVLVAVMINPQKDYMFTLTQREEIARVSCEGMDNVTVISSEGWLWKLAKDMGACAIVKGYRNDKDLEYKYPLTVEAIKPFFCLFKAALLLEIVCAL